MTAKQPDLMTPVDFIRRSLREVESDLKLARKNRAFTALAALHRQQRALRAELDAAIEAERQKRPEPSRDDAAIRARLRTVVAELPDYLIAELEDAIAARRAPRLREVSS